MRYLCLVYIDPALAGAASKEEWAEIDRESLAFNEEPKRTGQYLASNALADPKTATTLRIRDGKLSATDGPFAETEEHLGGFFLTEALGRPFDDALPGSPIFRPSPTAFQSVDLDLQTKQEHREGIHLRTKCPRYYLACRRTSQKPAQQNASSGTKFLKLRTPAAFVTG